MYKESGTNIFDLSKEAVKKWLNSFDAILTDCDGTLWIDNTAIMGSPDVIAKLQKCGKRVYFITCNGTITQHALWKRATGMGYRINEDNIIAPIRSIVEYLKARNFQKSIYVIGAAAIKDELMAAGMECKGKDIDVLNSNIDVNDYIERELSEDDHGMGAVVVGFDEHFTYCKMLKASNYLGANEQCLFLATNVDAVHTYPMYHIPGTGAILKAIEACVGRDAMVMAKPNPMVVESLMKAGKLVPSRTLMVGDCYKIDVSFGKNCGFQTLLVGSGIYKMADVLKLKENLGENRKYIPDLYINKLGDLLQYM